MNKEKSQYFRLGLFMLGGILLMMTVIVVLGAGRFFKKQILMETYIAGSVGGLNVGAPLNYRGVPVGKVLSIDLTANKYESNVRLQDQLNYILVTMEVTRPLTPGVASTEALGKTYEKLVPLGLRARLTIRNVTGLAVIEIENTDPTKFPPLPITWTPELPYLPSAPSQLDTMVDSVSKIVGNLEDLDLKGTNQSIQKLIGTMDRTVAEFNVSEVKKQINVLIDKTGTGIDDAKKTIELLRSKTDAIDTAGISDKIKSSLDGLDKTNGELQQVTIRVKNLTSLNEDDVASTLSNLRVIAENLRVITEDLKRYPGGVILGQPPAPARKEPSPAPGRNRN